MPPSTTAAQTCRWILLAVPAQASGETQSANDDAGDPLEAHQPGKQPVGAPVDVALVFVEEHVGAARRRRGLRWMDSRRHE